MQDQGPAAAPAAPHSSPPPQFVVPNAYHLHGAGISVSFFPKGTGPLVEGKGRLMLTYQDTYRSLSFYQGDVRTVAVPDLGTVVSVTLTITVDFGSTTFSLLLPEVHLANQTSTVPVHVEGVTTLHKSSIAPGLIRGQLASYTVSPLHGAASYEVLPD